MPLRLIAHMVDDFDRFALGCHKAVFIPYLRASQIMRRNRRSGGNTVDIFQGVQMVADMQFAVLQDSIVGLTGIARCQPADRILPGFLITSI